MERNRFKLLCCAGILSATVCLAQQSPLATLEIKTPTSEVKVGTKVLLQVTITNQSQQPFVVDKVSRRDGDAEAYTLVEVRDRNGRLLPRIDGQSFVENGKTYTLPKIRTSRKGATVNPGDKFRDFLVLSNLFDLSQPGSYTVTAKVQIRAPESGPEVRWIEAGSNKVTITVED